MKMGKNNTSPKPSAPVFLLFGVTGWRWNFHFQSEGCYFTDALRGEGGVNWKKYELLIKQHKMWQIVFFSTHSLTFPFKTCIFIVICIGRVKVVWGLICQWWHWCKAFHWKKIIREQKIGSIFFLLLCSWHLFILFSNTAAATVPDFFSVLTYQQPCTVMYSIKNSK